MSRCGDGGDGAPRCLPGHSKSWKQQQQPEERCAVLQWVTNALTMAADFLEAMQRQRATAAARGKEAAAAAAQARKSGNPKKRNK